MAEPVEWRADGTPSSARFDDVYRSEAGGLEQARDVFLRGCGLPQAWRSQRQWRILETGFGLGLNFLATWRAWRDDPQRCGLLHFVSIEAWPVSAADLVRSAKPFPELEPLAQNVADQWFGLVPGTHRLVFDQGRVMLTLHVNDVQDALRRERFVADSVFLDGFDPRTNPRMWELATLKGVARHCRRGTTLATWTASGEVRRDLAQCGFQVERAEGVLPKRHRVQSVFNPAWQPKGPAPHASIEPSHCVVVGAGLAGAAAATSLAARGWRVTVLDAARVPAAGASALPVGLLAPHISLDDNVLSRLSRAGVRATMVDARALLREGVDWRPTGALERRESSPAIWHEHAAWIKPAALVNAWLAHERIEWIGNTSVARVVRDGSSWQLLDAHGREIARAPLVIVAAALASAALLDAGVPLHPVRGQVSWGITQAHASLPDFPMNGNGHFIPGVPIDGQLAWFCGSSYDRGETSLEPRAVDHAANLERLKSLAPQAADALARAFEDGSVRAWTGVRCTSTNRRPVVHEVQPGLWLSTAMGSRGLTFSKLCAELMAARLHAEPPGIEARLADTLIPQLPPAARAAR